jgi:hypothetical protein
VSLRRLSGYLECLRDNAKPQDGAVWGVNYNDNGQRRDDLINEDDPHVQANMEVIREYLCRNLKALDLLKSQMLHFHTRLP